MATKWEVERAVFRDTRGDPARAWMRDLKVLASNHRLVMCALLSRADAETAVIEVEHTPSLSELAELTGLDRSTVRRSLNHLEKAGWVIRNRPDPGDARSKGARTWYQLGTPGRDGMPMPVEDEVGVGSPQGRGHVPPPEAEEVEADSPQPRGTVPPARGMEPPPVGVGSPQGRGHVPPIPLPTPKRPNKTKDNQHHPRASAATKRTSPRSPKAPPLPMDMPTARRAAAAPPAPAPVADLDPRPAVLASVTDELVAEFESGLTAKLDRRTRHDLARNTDELLTDGLTREQVRNGLILLFQNWHRCGPGMLRVFVQQAIAAASTPGNVHQLDRRARSDAAFAREAAIAAGADPGDPFASNADPFAPGGFFAAAADNVIDGEIITRGTA